MTLRLLADDLTGALDSAAMFASPDRPVRIRLDAPKAAERGNLGWVVPTRERDAAAARAMFDAAMPAFEGASVAFLKIDSLLRGPWPFAIAAALGSSRFDRIVIAPAFPAMGRVTRHGQTFVRSADGSARPTGASIAEQLGAAGVGEALVGGRLVVADAETDVDLQRLVALQGSGEAILWCGSAGLAQAIAGGARANLAVAGDRPLAIIGSNHPVTRAQIAAVAAAWPEAVLALKSAASDSPRRVSTALTEAGRALVYFALAEMPPENAAAEIARGLADLLPKLAPPGRLVAGGGETLMAICTVLGVSALDVSGAVQPGVPVSRLVGGVWGGIDAITKSGAFGDADALRQLLITPDRY